MEVAEMVHDLVREERGLEADVALVENPRGNETLVDEFAVDTAEARTRLGWVPDRSVSDSIRALIDS
jgi:nucleoside-diphosphate-sugar epimerase